MLGTKKWWRKWNNFLHRELGYFFVGMSVIYGLSGIALNHIGDWNPSFVLTQYEVAQKEKLPETKAGIEQWLLAHDIQHKYKKHYKPSDKFTKIFVDKGSVVVYNNGTASYVELINRRPIFYEVNMLHYNPGKLWTTFSDFFSVSLVLLAITGMFVLRGRNGITGRGKWLVAAGIIIPIVLLVDYL